MHATRLCLALLAATLLTPVGSADLDTTGCTVRTQAATQAGDVYAWGAYEIWQETNGIQGLQRGSSSCESRPSLPADTCYTHSETRRLVLCAQQATLGARP